MFGDILTLLVSFKTCCGCDISLFRHCFLHRSALAHGEYGLIVSIKNFESLTNLRNISRRGCFVTLVDRFDSVANVRRWGFLQPWETLACPCQTSQTIRTLCKPQQLPVFNALQPLQRLKLCFLQKNLQLAPLLNCFHCLWHVYLHVHKLSRKRKESGTQCALQCSSEWF